jgi:hypothetical protein
VLRFLADEDLNGHIIRGLLRAIPEIDLMSVDELGLLSATDAAVLAVAAEHQRIVITHDAKTMPRHAVERLNAGEPMPGLIVCPQRVSVGVAIENLVLIAECSEADDLRNRVVYLPL